MVIHFGLVFIYSYGSMDKEDMARGMACKIWLLGDEMAKSNTQKEMGHPRYIWNELKGYTKVEIGMANVNRIT